MSQQKKNESGDTLTSPQDTYSLQKDLENIAVSDVSGESTEPRVSEPFFELEIEDLNDDGIQVKTDRPAPSPVSEKSVREEPVPEESVSKEPRMYSEDLLEESVVHGLGADHTPNAPADDRIDAPPGSVPAQESPPTTTTDPLPAYEDFIFESHDGRFLFSGSEVKSLEENEEIPSYCQLVADFYTSPGPGVLTVEGNHKYAPVRARRKLQQIGEITDEFILHPLQNLTTGKNQSALFYQLIPRADKARLSLESEKSPEGFLLHDTLTLLAGLLKKMKKKGPVALALHLPEAMLVVAGDSKRVILARRYALAGVTPLAIADGFEVISQDLRTARKEAGMNIREVLWIESLAPELTWPDDYPIEDITFTRLPVFSLQQGENRVYSSLPALMGTVPRSTALSESADSLLVEIGNWEKWIVASVFSLALLIAGSGFWMQQHVGMLEQQSRRLTSDKRILQREYSSLVSSVGFNKQESTQAVEAAAAASKVQRVGQSVPMAAIWNDLAALRPPSCRIQALELTYEGTRAKIRIEGVIDLALTQAQSVYSAFLVALERGGFVVNTQNFQLDIDSNFFSMVLEKPFTG